MIEKPWFSEVYYQYPGFRKFKISAKFIPEKEIPQLRLTTLGCLFWGGERMEKQHFLQELTVARAPFSDSRVDVTFFNVCFYSLQKKEKCCPILCHCFF